MNYINQRVINIYSNTSRKQVIIFFVVFLLFTALALPAVNTYTTSIIGASESPDTNFSFNIDKIFSILDSYGKEGRSFYIIVRWTFDVVWPLIYSSFLITGIAYLARRSTCGMKHRFIYVPLIAVAFDFLENIFATILMVTYPLELQVFAYLLIISSILKWVILGLSFIIIIFLLARFTIKKIKNQLVQ